MRPDSRAVHAGREARPREPLAPPIVQASVHVFGDLGDYDAVARGDRPGHLYGRNSNENVEWLEQAVAALEDAPAALAVASGMAALHLGVTALVPRPAPIVYQRELYGVTLGLLREDLAPLGYELRAVDFADLDALRIALPGAGLAVCETITNPLCGVADLDRACALAAQAGVPVLVDNTFASPALVRPLEHGATAVVESATKYLGGHSDLVAGVLAGGVAVVGAARARAVRLGSTLGPFEAWLALRGVRTLALRMARSSTSSLRLAEALAGLDRVTRVHHPLLEGSPHFEVASRLLPEGSGGMLAFDLEGGRDAVQGLIDRLRMVRFAASFGGVETTISYPDLTSHRGLTAEERVALGITPGTVRVSTGLEDAADIVDDFTRAIG